MIMDKKNYIGSWEIFGAFFSELLIIIGAISISSLFIKSFSGNDGGLLVIGILCLFIGVFFRLGLKFFT